jgi:hypothetical protein
MLLGLLLVEEQAGVPEEQLGVLEVGAVVGAAGLGELGRGGAVRVLFPSSGSD